MDKNRIWTIGSVLLIVAVLGLGFLLGVQPQLAAIATANTERAAVEATNAAAEAKLAALKKQFEGIDELKTELATLVESVPTGANAPELVDQLDALAKGVGVTLTSITVADAQPYTPVEAVAAPAPAPDPESDQASADAVVVVPEPVAPPGAPPLTNPLVTPGNVAVLQVQVSVKGSYAQVLDYVNGLQSGKRLFLVTSLSTTASSENNGIVEATIGGLVYAALTPDLTGADLIANAQ
jgi:Tfp pilus assembly protein PilO